MSLVEKNRERAARAAKEGVAAFVGDPFVERHRGFARNRVYDGMPDAQIEAALVTRGLTPEAAVAMIAEAKATLPSLGAGIFMVTTGLVIMPLAAALLPYAPNEGGVKGVGILGGAALVVFIAGINRIRDVRDRRNKVTEKQAVS